MVNLMLADNNEIAFWALSALALVAAGFYIYLRFIAEKKQRRWAILAEIVVLVLTTIVVFLPNLESKDLFNPAFLATLAFTIYIIASMIARKR